MITSTEENYLKAIYNLTDDRETGAVGTNELAGHLKIAPATVSSMLKKLRDKQLINYKKYGGISLLAPGKEIAVGIIRKHRLWETFLVEKLEFTWDEIHEVAEQLEHIRSRKLVDQLDKLLGYPDYDPHGEPIPKENGETLHAHRNLLSKATPGRNYLVVGVKDDSPAFLRHITRLGLAIDARVCIDMVNAFDGSMELTVNDRTQVISKKVAENVLVN